MYGFQIIPTVLARHHLGVVFGMVAETNGPWLAEGERRHSIRFVRTRHEATAVLAAAGFARSTATVGIATVTRGPGFANAINALVAAVADRIPLVLIVAHATATSPPTQSLAQEQISAVVGAGYHLASSADDIDLVLSRAITLAAQHGKPHVVAIDDAALTGMARGGHTTAVDADVDAVGSSIIDTELASELLRGARRPLIIAGRGVSLAGCESEVVALAELVGARLSTTLRALGMFHHHPLNLGLVGGWAGEAARPYFASVDCVLALGASLSGHTLDHGRLFSTARVIHCVDALPPPAAGPTVLAITGDVARTVAHLAADLQHAGVEPAPFAGPSWDEVRQSVLDRPLGADPDRGFDVREVVLAVDAVLPHDRIVVTDSGRAVVPIPALIGAMDARSWHHGRGYGSIGLGLGLAIGAAVAHPDRRVVLFIGDGAFLQSCMDLDAARLAELSNLLIVVLDDERYGMEVGRLRLHDLPLDVIAQRGPDIVGIAHSYGVRAHTLAHLDDLAEVMLSTGGCPVLVHVPIDPETDQTAAVGNGEGIR